MKIEKKNNNLYLRSLFRHIYERLIWQNTWQSEMYQEQRNKYNERELIKAARNFLKIGVVRFQWWFRGNCRNKLYLTTQKKWYKSKTANFSRDRNRQHYKRHFKLINISNSAKQIPVSLQAKHFFHIRSLAVPAYHILTEV